MKSGDQPFTYAVRASFPGKAYGVRQPAVLVFLSATACVNTQVEHTLTQRLAVAAPGGQPVRHPWVTVAHSALHWSVVLQRRAGLPVFDSGRVLDSKVYNDGHAESMLLIPCPPGFPIAAARCMAWLAQWLCIATNQGVDEAVAQVDSLVAWLSGLAPAGKNTLHFLQAAHAAHIPWDRVTANYYQYGWGNRSELMQSSFTGQTSNLGVSLARHKHLGAEVLRRAGLPAPPHALATTVDEALKIASKLGYPVVVKPADTDGGVGVAAGLRNEASVRRAFAEAARHSERILVEKHFHGQDYRLLVFRGKLIWTILRQPAGLTGNGVNTIEQLVAHVNADPRRGTRAGSALKELVLDAEAYELLTEQAHTATTVPGAGEFVRLRRAANVAMGGVSIAANTDVHPDNRRLAEMAAQAFGLDLAGIDLLIPDIAVSWYQSGAAICEVNAQPQFGVNTQQHIHGEILKSLVPHGGRIPTMVLVGANNVEVLRVLQELLAQRHMHLGLATAQAAFVNGERQGKASNLFQATQTLLFNKQVDALIIDVSNAGVLQTGLPVDEYDVMLVASDFGAEHAGKLLPVMRMLAPHNRGPLLLNAEVAACANLASSVKNTTLLGTTTSNKLSDADFSAAILATEIVNHLRYSAH